jgi:nucleotide-binding universal stress UspA family protein
MYKKALVPLDGSELAECALPHVKNLVKEGAVGEVTILNIYKVDIRWLRGSDEAGLRGSQMMDIDKFIKEKSAESTTYLASVESRLASEGVKVKTVSLEGNYPADTISDYAQKNGMDMIVIATHGYTGIKKLMFGSVALGVLHESHVPILLIRP